MGHDRSGEMQNKHSVIPPFQLLDTELEIKVSFWENMSKEGVVPTPSPNSCIVLHNRSWTGESQIIVIDCDYNSFVFNLCISNLPIEAITEYNRAHMYSFVPTCPLKKKGALLQHLIERQLYTMNKIDGSKKCATINDIFQSIKNALFKILLFRNMKINSK